MRRPPANLDDFLRGGEGTTPESPAGSSEPPTPEAPKDEAPKQASKTAAEKIIANKKPAKRSGQNKSQKPAAHTKPAAAAPTAGTRPRTKSTRGPSRQSSNQPSPRKVPAPMIEPTEAPSESGDRRGRTVPGEAAPTVIMSVRVPIDLRERLEDILAAYSGVTFSDLVIRGLQTMVNEVEQRHRERTGEELPRRQSRPEFPL